MKPSTVRVRYLLTTLLACFVQTAGASNSPFSDNMFQSPMLNMPSRGSIAGEYGSTVWSASEITKGIFSLSLGIEYPNERGSLLYPINPNYSPSSGLGEWGMGISMELSIKRFRIQGELDYKTDDLLTPWGRF